MSKRIFELLKQATTSANPVDREWVFYRIDQVEFAELIILECLTICEELGDKGMDGHYCADAISKTFRN
jgi:hypothetical protein